MTKITESAIEKFAIELLESSGYQYIYAPDIAPDSETSERESFEDEEAAGYLNDTFVCIKVDREERPDIDAVYMAACQMLTGSGGWPLSIFMTPQKKPFYAAPIFPSKAVRAGQG